MAILRLFPVVGDRVMDDLIGSPDSWSMSTPWVGRLGDSKGLGLSVKIKRLFMGSWV